MNNSLHSAKHFDFAAWQNLDLFDQLGNISSEVGRSFQALRIGDEARARGAFLRGIDLLNATIQTLASSKKQSKLNLARLKEVLYAREEFSKAYLAGQPDLKLEEYFHHFALLAKLKFLKQF